MVSALAGCGTSRQTHPRETTSVHTTAHERLGVADLWSRTVQRNPEHWFDCVDASKGVSVARALDCEREDSIHDFRHLCGGAVHDVLSPLFASISAQARRAEANDPGNARFECVRGRFLECNVAPLTECESTFFVAFEGDLAPCLIRAVIERDDWQSTDEHRAETDAKIEALLKDTRGCPR